ncbi:MAG TPA: DHA2 family efflux MFS transporter permease subunit [Candidatus Rhabdochlamydia sp.]|jgi:MFS transporter, DHA2 family, multidrug resistance protein|nr:DHA2 family efflux MFS transporter permease subunit [Candidatus Rhabdochlamydia sp.]
MEPLSKTQQVLATFTLALASLTVVLDYSVANVSLAYIAGDLGISTNEGIYVITSFAVGNAIALPITNWLSKRLGDVKLMTLSLLLFVLFSAGCGLAHKVPELIIFRFLQGFVAGPLIPLSQTLLLGIHPPHKKQMAIALWGTVVIVGPITGPIIGGWITYNYSWPWIFYINIPIGLLSTCVIWAILRKRESRIEKLTLDWVGLLLLTIGVVCLQILIDKGEEWDWFSSYLVRGLTISTSLSFILLGIWSFFHKSPLIDLTLFKIRSYTTSIITLLLASSSYFGSVVLIPLWLQQNMGYTAEWAGFALAPIGFAPILFSRWIPKLLDKLGTLVLFSISFSFFAFSCFFTSNFNTDISINMVYLTRFIFGLGVLFYVVPLFSLSLQDIPPDKLNSSSGFFNFIRSMVSGIGASIFTTLWIRRSAYHHSILVESITPFSQETHRFLTDLSKIRLDGPQTQEFLNETINTQAAVLGLNDCFFLMGWIFLGLIPLVFLGKGRKALPQPSVIARPE